MSLIMHPSTSTAATSSSPSQYEAVFSQAEIAKIREIIQGMLHYSKETIAALNTSFEIIKKDAVVYFFLLHLASSLQNDFEYRESLLTLFLEDPSFPTTFSLIILSDASSTLPEIQTLIAQFATYYRLSEDTEEINRASHYPETAPTLTPILIPPVLTEPKTSTDTPLLFSKTFLEKLSSKFNLRTSPNPILKSFLAHPDVAVFERYNFELLAMFFNSFVTQIEHHGNEGVDVSEIMLLALQIYITACSRHFQDKRFNLFSEYFENLHLTHPEILKSWLTELKTMYAQANEGKKEINESITNLTRLCGNINIPSPDETPSLNERINYLEKVFFAGTFTRNDINSLFLDKALLTQFMTLKHNILKQFYLKDSLFQKRYKELFPWKPTEAFSAELTKECKKDNALILPLRDCTKETIEYLKRNEAKKTPPQVKEECDHLELMSKILHVLGRPVFTNYESFLFSKITQDIKDQKIENLEAFFKQHPHMDNTSDFYLRLFFIALQMDPPEYREKLINLFLDYQSLPPVILSHSLLSDNADLPYPKNLQITLPCFETIAISGQALLLSSTYTIWLILTTRSHHISEEMINRVLKTFDVENSPEMLLRVLQLGNYVVNPCVDSVFYKTFINYSPEAIYAIFLFLKSHVTDKNNAASFASLAASLYLIAEKRQAEHPSFSLMLKFFKEELKETYPSVLENWLTTALRWKHRLTLLTILAFGVDRNFVINLTDKALADEIEHQQSQSATSASLPPGSPAPTVPADVSNYQRKKEAKKAKAEERKARAQAAASSSPESDSSNENTSSSYTYTWKRMETSSSSSAATSGYSSLNSSPPSIISTATIPSVSENKKPALTIYEACEKGNLDELKKLITPENLNQANEEGYTLLHLACRAGHENIIEYLLKQKNIKVSPHNDNTPKLLPVTPLRLLIEANVTISGKILHALIDKITDWSLEPPYHFEYFENIFKKWGQGQSQTTERFLKKIKDVILGATKKSKQLSKSSASSSNASTTMQMR